MMFLLNSLALFRSERASAHLERELLTDFRSEIDMSEKRGSRFAWALPFACLLAACSSPQSEVETLGTAVSELSTVGVTQGADESRTSWYLDEPGLGPQIVGSSTFGRLFSTPVLG